MLITKTSRSVHQFQCYVVLFMYYGSEKIDIFYCVNLLLTKIFTNRPTSNKYVFVCVYESSHFYDTQNGFVFMDV